MASRHEGDRFAAYADDLGEGAFLRGLFYASSSTVAPTWYVFLREERHLVEILRAYPELSPEMLSPMRRVSFEARDGLVIPAYLTGPGGADWAAAARGS